MTDNIKRHIAFYEAEIERLAPNFRQLRTNNERVEYIDKHLHKDTTRGKWELVIKKDAAREYKEPFDSGKIVEAIYRPFYKSFLYNSRLLNNSRYRIPSIFPTPAHTNRVIQVTGTGSSIPFSCLMSDCIPDLEVISKGQCHSLYYYEPANESKQGDLLSSAEPQAKGQNDYIRHDAITDAALADFQIHYSDNTITKEGIFHYTYGVLHSPEYRQCYGADLKKVWPRIPYAPDFHAFRQAGEALAELHTGYESAQPYPLTEESDSLDLDPATHYRIKKMAHPGKRGEQDRSVIVVNDHLRLAGIPDKAYEYIVNGKSVLAWVMERYQYTKDKDSGIINDPNEWSDDPAYIMELIKRVVTVSVETVRIVEGLPAIEKPNADGQEAEEAVSVTS